jgi:hypothetical protein
MASQLHPHDQGDAISSQWSIWTGALPTPAPGSKLNWTLFLLVLLVFAADVVVAVLAWVLVGLVLN